jgi:plasmid replication initiation protein
MKKQEIVTKSNRLIEASYRLDIAEQRIILMAISDSRNTGQGITPDNFLTIRADDYATLFGIDMAHAYNQLKGAAKTLFNRQVVVRGIDKETGKPSITTARWVQEITYVEGAGLIRVLFSSMMTPYITRLEKEFTSYKIESVSKMTSTYAIRLYELLIQWEKIGTRDIDLQDIKNMLGVDTEYASLKNFKARVLDVAVSQVNDHSDLNVSYENIKLGRVVTGFRFSFESKPAPKPKPAPKKIKLATSPPPKNIASFAGIERQAFAALQRDFDYQTEDHVRSMMVKFNLDAISTMTKIRKELAPDPDSFTLEKSD